MEAMGEMIVKHVRPGHGKKYIGSTECRIDCRAIS